MTYNFLIVMALIQLVLYGLFSLISSSGIALVFLSGAGFCALVSFVGLLWFD